MDPLDTNRRSGYIDNESADDYRQRNRQFFEDKLRRDRSQIGIWIRYAAFEESQKEFGRARSIYERVLDVDPYNITVFLKYAEMEMKCKHMNMARNVWDRAVTIQPRVSQFWYKYVFMEETLGNINEAREVYERWMNWIPEESVWQSYIKFEKRYKQWDRIRSIFERFITAYPTTNAFLQYAKFEEDGKRVDAARRNYERALDTLEADQREPRLFIEFARFEVRMKEFDRARAIYRLALDHYAKSEAEGLYNSYAQFERQFGSEQDMVNIVLLKRRTFYEEQVAEAPHDYDSWFDYLRLEEGNGDVDIIRELYERAIANVPPAPEKRLWRRYIYLWLYYAIFEELQGDNERAGAVYRGALEIVPHQQFTFAKLWSAYAKFLIRQGDVSGARRTLGRALGTCPKPKLFKDYIELEVQLREFDRCRTIYEKYLEYDPTNGAVWLKFAELERLLGDDVRAHAIYEMALEQPVDMPELLWKAYIDYEYESEEYEAARSLYERLLQRTEHIKVWVSYANFESSLPDIDAMSRARIILERAYESLKLQGLVMERILLLETWKEMETRHELDSEDVTKVSIKFPRTIVKQRDTDDGGVEEYVEYIFPEDEPKAPAGTSKLLAMAHQWKKAKGQTDE